MRAQYTTKRTRRTASKIAMRHAASRSGQLIKASDLEGTSPGAASKALARLAAKGSLQRVAKGIYYAPKQTLLGPSQPSEAAIAAKALEGRTRPTGATAANLLGLSTQVPVRPEFIGFVSRKASHTNGVRLKIRRGRQSESLKAWQGAFLEVLRDGGRFVEAEPENAIECLTNLLAREGSSRSLRLLVQSALGEPPRVRAILGALMAHLGSPESLWKPLNASLNPLTRFDFGIFKPLPNSKDWQAK